MIKPFFILYSDSQNRFKPFNEPKAHFENNVLVWQKTVLKCFNHHLIWSPFLLLKAFMNLKINFKMWSLDEKNENILL